MTLTYRDECLPPGGSLRPADFVGFMKRLRWKLGGKVRFFQCGEYGERLSRPHHHALFFGVGFPDKKFFRESPGGGALYTSDMLDATWGHGFCSIGEVSFESASYVARYALKKVVGPGAAAHYGGRIAEYLTMSRRPGIGRSYIDKYGKEVYAADSVVVRGVECKPPRYYDAQLERESPSVYARIKGRRRAEAAADTDNRGSRLYVKEAVKEAAMANLIRQMEHMR